MSTKNRKNCENFPDDCSLTTTTRNNEPSVHLYWGCVGQVVLMFELQDGFLLGFLSPYLSEIHCPIFNTVNPKSQKNDIPSVLIVQDGLNEKK